MMDNNLQEQYELIEEEKKENRKKTIIIILLCLLIIIITIIGVFFSISGSDKACTLNCDINGDGIPELNIDTDGDGICDINCDTDGDGKPDINIDTDNDGKPEDNLIDQDTNGDGICDLNCDTNNDGKPDTNIDIDGDGKPDINIDNNNDGICDVNCDTNGDGKPDTNIDIDGDGKPDVNIDNNNDGKPDENIKDQDTNGDGVCDVNCDTDGDGIPDTNVDIDGNGTCDLNCDTNGDGVCDTNCIGELYSNADLSSLKVGNYTLKPNFNSNVTEYTVEVDSDLTSVMVSATALNSRARVIGTGNVSLPSSSTRVSITVIAENGTTKTYNVTITKSDDPSISEEGDGDFEIGTIENGTLSVNFTKPLKVDNVYPMEEGEYLTHEFVLTNNSNKTITYDVNLLDVTNTFTSNNFVYSLTLNGKTIVNETPALKQNGTIAHELVINPGETASFSINYRLVETCEGKDPNTCPNQDYDKGKSYRGTVEIRVLSAN